MSSARKTIGDAFRAAWPIMLGYVSIGIPAGIMEDAIGLTPFMAFLASLMNYSGAGQFMVPNMLLAGNSIAATVASISFVNTRQLLYSAAFAPYFDKASRALSLVFAHTVTDESFGVNMERYGSAEGWDAERATLVNLFSHMSWCCSNALGCWAGSKLSIPLDISSFAMTAIFICLLVTQKLDRRNLVVMAVSIVAVYLFKLAGLSGAAILFGALAGVGVGVLMGPEPDVQAVGDEL